MSSAQAASAAFHVIADEWWAWRLAEEPLFASFVGEHAYDDRWPDVSPAAYARRATKASEFQNRLADIEPDVLEVEDRISLGTLNTLLDDVIQEEKFRMYQMPVQSSGGYHVYATRMPDQMPFRTAEDYERYIGRLRAWPAHVAQQIENMRAGIREGRVLPAAALTNIVGTIEAHVVSQPEESVFWAPFERIPTTFSEPATEALLDAGREAIAEAIVPGYQSFLEFVRNEYVPAGRANIAATELPDGGEFYSWRVRHFTTLDISPKEVHEIGLSEVARIRREMDFVIESSGFSGTFTEYLTHLRSDPQFTPASADALLREGAWIAMQMNAKLPTLFGRLPRLPYTVQQTPDAIAPGFTAGFYVEPPVGGRVPGVYWLNTFDLPARPLYNLEALTFHEAVPGHHLQIALAQELDHLPPYRRALVLTAYEEGWGLYAEFLGTEAGFYQDPASRFGQLSYEMWRACRLVVDTGMHFLGWSREQAVAYLADRTALSLREVNTEIDRYIGWPGQALGYKMGELTIRRLRTEAEASLGTRFDVRAFHDEVLGHGELPMGVLEQVIHAWIAQQQ